MQHAKQISQLFSVVNGFLLFVCYGIASGFTGKGENHPSQNNVNLSDIYCGLEENQAQILKPL